MDRRRTGGRAEEERERRRIMYICWSLDDDMMMIVGRSRNSQAREEPKKFENFIELDVLSRTQRTCPSTHRRYWGSLRVSDTHAHSHTHTHLALGVAPGTLPVFPGSTAQRLQAPRHASSLRRLLSSGDVRDDAPHRIQHSCFGW